MLLVGEQSAFLSHLPKFDGTNEAGSEFTSPHRFQVILQASFSRGTEVLHLSGDVHVVFPDRKNVAADRIRSTQRLAGRLRRAGAAEMDVRVSAGREFYFEEGELLVPATFDPTPEEKKPL
jgi:hypothetical protein